MTQIWLGATLGLLVPLLLAVIACGRGPVPSRLPAFQFASTLGGLTLVAMSYAFDMASAIDLALAVVLLAVPGGLIYAIFYERWL